MDPISQLSLGLGAAKGVTGILGAIGGHSEKAAAARRQNEQLRRQYRQKLKIYEQDWVQKTGLYAARQGIYQQGNRNRQRAASLAQGRNQQRLNDVYTGQSVQTQNMMVQLARLQGRAAASGKSGRGAVRQDLNPVGQFVRNQGVMAKTLMSSRLAMDNANLDVLRRQENANNAAYSKVAIAPMKPVAPVKPVQNVGPSGLSLMAGIGSAAIDGFSFGTGIDKQLRA